MNLSNFKIYVSGLLLIITGCIPDDLTNGSEAVLMSDNSKVEIPKIMTLTQYIELVTNKANQLHIYKTDSNSFSAVWYKPVDFCVLQETGITVSKKQFTESKKEYSGAVYFELRINNKNLQSVNGKQDTISQVWKSSLMNYFGYEIQSDLIFVNGKDSFPCILSQYLNQYSISNQNIILCAFERGKNFKEPRLIWKNKFENQKPVVYQFDEKILSRFDNINLKFNNN